MPTERIDWEAERQKINRVAFQDKSICFALSMIDLKKTVTVDESINLFFETGSLWAERRRIKVSTNPCNTTVQEAGRLKDRVTVSKTEIVSLTRSWSQTASQTVQRSLNEKFGFSAGTDATGRFSAEFGKQLTNSRGYSQMSSNSLTQAVQRSETVQSELTLTARAPLCHKVEVPIGIRLRIKITGTMTIQRYPDVVENANGTFSVGGFWKLTDIKSKLRIEALAQPDLNMDGMTVTRVACATCPGDPVADGSFDGRLPQAPAPDPAPPAPAPDPSPAPAPRMLRPRRKPRWISRGGNAPLGTLPGIDDTTLAHLGEVGVESLGGLALSLTPELGGLGREGTGRLRALATFMASFEEIGPEEALIIVDGFGWDDVHHLNIGPVPTEVEVAEAARRVRFDRLRADDQLTEETDPWTEFEDPSKAQRAVIRWIDFYDTEPIH